MTIQQAFAYFQEDHAQDFMQEVGTLPVLFSAPHTYEHPRKNRIKPAEQACGVLTRLLAEQTGCYAFYKSRANQEDPNYDPQSPYRDALVDLIQKNKIRYLIDLHELHPKREQLINPLINGGKNILHYEDAYMCLKKRFEEAGFPVSEDIPYAGKTKNRVAADVNARCGIFALQLELNASLLYPRSPHCRLQEVMQVLQAVTFDLINLRK